MLAQVCNERAVEKFFKLNLPRFDSVEVRHIVPDQENTAKEILSCLRDDPDSFEELAAKHSLAETKATGGGRFSVTALRRLPDAL